MTTMKKKEEPFDFDGFDCGRKAAEGVIYNVKDPRTGKDLPGVWTKILGTDSDAWQKSNDAWASELALMTEPEREKALSYENRTARNRERIADMIVDWGGHRLKGKEVEYSRANVLMWLEMYPWYYDQHNTEIAKRQLFLPPL